MMMVPTVVVSATVMVMMRMEQQTSDRHTGQTT
jgi:hypothetical protein